MCPRGGGVMCPRGGGSCALGEGGSCALGEGGSCALGEGGSCALGEGVHVPSGSSILSSCYSISNCDHFKKTYCSFYCLSLLSYIIMHYSMR